MSTHLANEFQANIYEMTSIGQAQPNVVFASNISLQNQFGAATGSSPVGVSSLQNTINPPEPIVVPSQEGPDLSKPAFQSYQAEATGDFLRNSGFESKNVGDVAYLGTSVANVTMDLFSSLQSKAPEMDASDPSLSPNAPQLAMNNFAPRAPGPAVFGL